MTIEVLDNFSISRNLSLSFFLIPSFFRSIYLFSPFLSIFLSPPLAESVEGSLCMLDNGVRPLAVTDVLKSLNKIVSAPAAFGNRSSTEGNKRWPLYMDAPFYSKCCPLKSPHCLMVMKWVLYIKQNFKPINSNDDVSTWVKNSRFR